VLPAIEIFDISDLAMPAKVGELALPTRPGLGTESHDITFADDGRRAYSAALSQGVIIDTANPAQPAVISSFLDPTINVWHQMDPYTTTDAAGNKREFLIAEDEFVGAVGTSQCPTGGVHVYEITGDKVNSPEKVGYWNIDTLGPTDEPEMRCTAHVLDIHERESIMTLSFYNGGVWVVDLSGLEGVSLADRQISGAGMKAIGHFRIEGGESWASKTPLINKATGDFFLFSNDIKRGLDVFKFEGAGPRSQLQGRWMSPAQAKAYFAGLPRLAPTRANGALVCLLPE
jgi:hypothetical protein